MNVVGFNGFTGSSLHWIDLRNFVFVSGNGLCVCDIEAGPRCVVFRSEHGIGSICSSVTSKSIAVSRDRAGGDIDLLSSESFDHIGSIKNPSSGKIMDMCFSRDGSVLVVLSDYSDHMLFAMDFSKNRMLFCKKLKNLYKHCVMNPVDPTKLFLYGDSGVCVCTISEYINDFKLNMEDVKLPGELNNDEHLDYTMSKLSNSVTFAVWAPKNTLLIGSVDGLIYQYHVDNSQFKVIASLVISDDERNIGFARDGFLTSQYLIVGTTEGLIQWFSIAAINKVDWSDVDKGPGRNLVTFSNEYVIPSQIMHLRREEIRMRHLGSLCADPSVSMGIAGLSCGAIYRFSVDVQIIVRHDQEDEIGSRSSSLNQDVTIDVASEPIYQLHDGVPLCSATLTLPIGNAPKNQKLLAELVALGSHRGEVSFWVSSQTDEIESPALRGQIHGSITPKMPKVVGRFVTADKSPVTVVEVLPLNGQRGGCRLFAVGTASGWLEVWSLEATTEEDQDEDESEQLPIAVEAKMVSRRKLFLSAVSIMKSSPWQQLVAVGSTGDSKLYIFDVKSAATFQLIDFIDTKSVSSFPSSCVWRPEDLWIFCKNGSFLSYSSLNVTVSTEGGFHDEPFVVWNNKNHIPLAHVTLNSFESPGCVISIAFDNKKVTVLQSLPSNISKTEFSKMNGTIHSPKTLPSEFSTSEAMSSNTICAAISADGLRYATGCLDGSVYLWNISKDADTGLISVHLAARYAIHASSVICLCFTVDCLQLVSCGADSAIFYIAIGGHGVDPVTALSKYLPPTAAADSEFQKFRSAEEKANLTFSDVQLLSNYKQTAMLQLIQNKNNKSVTEIRESIEGVVDRLKTLLSKNEKADDIEKMEISEFVIDVNGRDSLLKSNNDRVAQIMSHYNLINTKNELIAARIRQLCWDSMESSVRRLLPMQTPITENTGSFASSQFPYVCSFPVKALTEAQLTLLSRIKRLRSIEIRFQNQQSKELNSAMGSSTQLPSGSWRSTWESNSHKWNPVLLSWILNDGARWPSDNIIDELLRREKERIEEDSMAAEKAKAALAADNSGAGSVPTEEDDVGGDNDKFIDENSIFNMLLPPTSVRTSIQKRNQIVLLNEYCRIIKIKFNVAFDKLCREKDDALASIEARNVRIREVFEELTQFEELQTFNLSDVEIAGTDIKISSGDLSVKPYESMVARAQRLKDEEEKRRRDAENNKADVKGRALHDMMNGVLEVKKDMFTSASTIQKPSWYVDGLTVDKMNDSQRKEFEEYESLIAAAQEEQNKYRKLLEMEIKKLKGEISETTKTFDEKLFQMSKLRMFTQRELLAQEMYMSNIALSMVKREVLTTRLKKIEARSDEIRVERNEIVSTMQHLSVKIEEKKNELADVQEEEKSMDKTFRRDIQTLCNTDFDQDTLKVLQTLFKVRHYPKKAGESAEDNQIGEDDAARQNDVSGMGMSGMQDLNGSKAISKMVSKNASHQVKSSANRQSANSGQNSGSKKASDGEAGLLQEAAKALDKPKDAGFVLTTRNPFYKEIKSDEKAKREAESHYPLLSPLYMDRDCPDGFNVDQFVWVKLQELRHSRIEREIQGKRMAHELFLLKGKLEELASADSDASSALEDLRTENFSIVNEMNSLDSRLNVVVAMRQGQDEVDQDAVATDYSTAKLIPANIIQNFNYKINELGREKISVLSRTKQFRRKMNLIGWEAVHLGMEANHLNELYTDAQLLKVTRDLQKVIREGSNPEQMKLRLEKIAARKTYLSAEFTKKLQKATRVNEELQGIYDERAEENKSLLVQIEELQKDVAVRTSVRKARGLDDTLIETKMKKVMQRRHLVDTVRLQAEQISLLKDELDNLRQKTYPSFVRATRTRLAANPDERG